METILTDIDQASVNLILANSGFIGVMQGPVKDTERRPDQQVEQIKKNFLNFGVKMQSPDFILPLRISYNRQRQLGSLENIRNGLINLIKTCRAFELPGYGFLTRHEAVCFVNYHTQRHIYQLRNIYHHLVLKN